MLCSYFLYLVGHPRQYPRLTSGSFYVNRQASQVIVVWPCLSLWYAAENQTTRECLMVVVAVKIAQIMEGQHWGMDRPDVVVVAAHRRRDISRWATIAVDASVWVPQRRLGDATVRSLFDQRRTVIRKIQNYVCESTRRTVGVQRFSTCLHSNGWGHG